VLTLPQPLPSEDLLSLKRSLTNALGDLQGEMGGGGADAGEAEYASWLQRLGAVRH
jgi:hypothetical protein